jgi:precorrin-2/cobalt-factor-2 C20-methyltransferase
MIPGITAMSSCSCGVLSPLALGDDILTVIPATFEDDRIEHVLIHHDSIVLMKIHRSMERVVALLDRTGLAEKAILVERCGMEGQRIYQDIREAAGRSLHYFSTILIRKRGLESVTGGEG